MENLFQYGTKNRLRFDTSRGQIDIEALWQMPLTSKDEYNLDAVAKTIARAIRATEEESFVALRTTANEVMSIKLEIVKTIIADKLEALNIAKNQAAIKAKKEILVTALANKENEAILAMSAEEIKAELDKLNGQVAK